MKKALAILLALMLAFSLVACGGGGDDTTTDGGDDGGSTGDTYKIILITMDKMDQHWVNVDAGCQKAVAELGNVDYTWMAPDKKDDAKQIEMINNAVADNADCILLAANGPDSVTTALQDAEDAGVKIVYVDSPANYTGAKTFATNNTNAGTTAGEELLAALDAAGVTSGDIGIVNVNAATQSTVDREAGFRAAFEGTDFNILETQYGEGDAAASQQLAENFITQGVVGLFGCNEGSTVGVGNAIKEDGGGVLGVGFDKSDAIMGLIDEGFLVCTMAQNPDVMGYDGMKFAAGLLAGTETADGAVIDTGVTALKAS